MIQSTSHYKLRSRSELWERLATMFVWLVSAGLLGWVIALAIGVLAARETAKLPLWTPPVISRDAGPRQAAAPVVASTTASWQWVGIVDDRVYARSNNKPVSFAAGETLPNGDVLKAIERDAIVVLSAGKESRLTLFKAATSAAAAVSTTAVSGATANSAATAGCRLNAQDRASAVYLEASISAALARETTLFTRIFVPVIGAEGGFIGGSSAGVRATATGGTTAMFGIQDGDTLLRADGKPLTSGLNVMSDVIGRLQRGEAVVVEGERAGMPRRWVFAPAVCRP